MNNKLTPSIVQRLAFVKYLFGVAIEQSRQSEPMNSASILAFHDSVELFLSISCEHLSISTDKRITFMEYWDKIKDDKNITLSQEETMKRMNNARVSLKHHGTMPSRLDIETFRANVSAFFEDNTPLVFEVNFDEITLLNLVKYDNVKESIKKAEEFQKEEKYNDALFNIGKAFRELLVYYKQRLYNTDIHRRANFLVKLANSEFSMDAFHSFARDMINNIDILQNEVQIVGLGLDYGKYIKFNQIIPQILEHSNSGVMGYRVLRKQAPTNEEVEFCKEFVIQCAIRLQEYEE